MLTGGLPEALARARAAAEARMRGRVKVERLSGVVTTDPDTGELIDGRTLIYEGKARSHYTGTPWPEMPDVAASTRWRRPIFVSIPIGVALEVGDRVTILDEPDTPQLVGNKYRVVEPGNASQESAQRILCHDTGEHAEVTDG